MGDHVEESFIRNAKWQYNEDHWGLHELFAEDKTLLAWVQTRSMYCDRGHYQGQLEYSPGNPFDFADGNGMHYYMHIEVAKQELFEKLLWRLCKVRAE